MNLLTRARRRASVVLSAVSVVAVAMMASASAAAANPLWYEGPTGSEVTAMKAPASVTASMSSPIKLTFKVLSFVELTASGAECVGCTLENAEVEAGGGVRAAGYETIRLTGVTVGPESPNCQVQSIEPSGELDPIGVVQFRKQRVIAEPSIGRGLLKFQNAVSPNSVAVALRLSGAACGNAGSYNLFGYLGAAEANPTLLTVAATSHRFVLSGGPTLRYLNKEVLVSGSLEEKLTSGRYWAAR